MLGVHYWAAMWLRLSEWVNPSWISLHNKRSHTKSYEELFRFLPENRRFVCSHSNLRTARMRKSSSFGNACYAGYTWMDVVPLAESLKICVP